MLDLSPMVILTIGVVAVLGMIMVLRVNAFIALITAAILVSLLAPGELSEKITRVAQAFGGAVGNIGIVIAMAAVIGKCLMDSGAADRIVRAFLGALGEKRTSWALMGSGFVLSVPVFFDTVFYLLVPLARSLYGRTQKNYMLYLMAICAGGVITHTLVPPTPGPLFIAAEFKIDLGLMILAGVMVGIPTAIVALFICKLLNRLVPVPMRTYSDEPASDPLQDEELPPLWLSLLPVLLPVILISTNTIANVFARSEQTRLLSQNILSAQIVADDPAAQGLAKDLAKVGPRADMEAEALSAALVKERVRVDPNEASVLAGQLVSANVFAILDEAPRPARTAADVTAVLGSPNLALLLSAIIAMGMLVWKRRMPLKELAEGVDKALMSGGIIILITAGGGAFGKMLQAAGIKETIEETFGSGGDNVGLMIFVAAFGVASLLKFAQGSSTVAMITTSSMFAAMGITTEMLGCHHVYLALTIGAGSLVGSWMNDSGFWIVAKMGVLTEAEALKTWTVLLALVGCTSFGFTLLYSRLLPMI